MARYGSSKTPTRLSPQIGRIDTQGNYSSYPGAMVFCPLEFAFPTIVYSSITSGPDGALSFTGSGSIGRITTTGQVNYFPVPNSSCLGGITTGPDGTLWFADSYESKIGRITGSGEITEFSAPPNSYPRGLQRG